MPDGLTPSNAPWLLCMGTRPEIVTMAPVYRALRAAGERVSVLHAGQDDADAWPLYRLFAMRPECEIALSQPRAGQAHLTGELLARIGEAIEFIRPRTVLVQGAAFAALAAATAAYFAGIPVGHVGAGLRAHPMRELREEKNREMIARLAALHFAPTVEARANLLREGIDDAHIVVTGSTVVDSTRLAIERLRVSGDPAVDAEVTDFIAAHAAHRLVTVSADGRERGDAGIDSIAAAVVRILREHADVAVVWPMIANPAVAQAVAAGLAGLDPLSAARLLLAPSIEYPTLIATLQASWIVLSDCGGFDEEALAMGVPTLACRAAAERPEILPANYTQPAGTSVDSICMAFDALTFDRAAYASKRWPAGVSPLGDGHAGERIVEALLQTV